MAELLYGARLRDDKPSIMAAVRAFLAREAHARIRVRAKRLGRSAGAFEIVIAAHAEALGVTRGQGHRHLMRYELIKPRRAGLLLPHRHSR
jgi:predicted nucleic acid-binding protein